MPVGFSSYIHRRWKDVMQTAYVNSTQDSSVFWIFVLFFCGVLHISSIFPDAPVATPASATCVRRGKRPVFRNSSTFKFWSLVQKKSFQTFPDRSSIAILKSWIGHFFGLSHQIISKGRFVDLRAFNKWIEQKRDDGFLTCEERLATREVQ